MSTSTPPRPLPPRPPPRLVPGEWRCRDCGHLSYGDATAPRCPNCYSTRLVATLDQRPSPQQPTLAADGGPVPSGIRVAG
jgi:hypothetical protein